MTALLAQLRKYRRILVGCCMFVGPALTPSLAADEDRTPDPVYMTGAEVQIDKPIEGDLIAAAGRIHVQQPIGGDALLGAGSLDLQGPVGEDLRAAGGIVTIASRVNGDAIVAAGRITLSRTGELHGHALLAGANVTLDGRSMANLKVYGRDVAMGGEIFGPLDVSAERIAVRSTARIYGDVVYSSREPIQIDPGAQIMGKLTQAPGQLHVARADEKLAALKPLRPFLLAGIFAAGVLLLSLFPASRWGR